MKKPIETWKKLRTKLLDKYSTSLVYVYILLYRYMEDLISQASSIAHLLKSNPGSSTVPGDHWEDGLGARLTASELFMRRIRLQDSTNIFQGTSPTSIQSPSLSS